MIGIRLKANKKDTKYKLKEFLNPKYVYFKIDEKDKLLVKENDKVKMGDKIIERNYFINSSVSGKVTKIVELLDSKNNVCKFLEIENDFKENHSFKKPIIKTKEDFIKLLKEKGIIGLSGNGFPSYIKYDNEIKTLIVNAVECEPYITADNVVCFKYINKIVKALEQIKEIFSIEEIIIAIKIGNRNLLEKIIPAINSYDFISVVQVPNLYPMGWEKSLVRYIKHTDYEKLPTEKNIVVSNASTIYSISEALEGKPLIERVITISGESFKKKINVKIKIGTLFEELKDIYKGYKNDDVTLISGGPMMGYSLSKESFVLDPSVNAVLALKKAKEDIATTCIRCGKCSDHCPAKICPVLVKDNINDKEELKRLDVSRCIECGICSFICPARINLREYLKEAKGKVK